MTEGLTTDLQLPKIISLFSGAGGLDLGFHQAKFPLSFAVDISSSAIRSHQRYFKATTALAADLEELGPNGVMNKLSRILVPGEKVGVIGGPPCQGFSRANSFASPHDPRNRLAYIYLHIVEAIQRVYDVEFVLFENVKGIRDVKHAEAFEGILSKFEEMNLVPKVSEYSALEFGVPQTRNRVIISGFRRAEAAARYKPKKTHLDPQDLTVRRAINGLPEPLYYKRNINKAEIPYHENHWTMRPVSKKFSQPGGVRSKGRSFRRLDWDKPSPTVAYGHREIHVHPEGHRRLSIYEAMLLQGFPHSFVLEGTLSSQVEQVSNAVPPPLAYALASAVAYALKATAVSLEPFTRGQSYEITPNAI